MANKRLLVGWAGASLLAMVILGVGAKALLTRREPVYQGRRLTYWLGEVFTTNQAQALQVLKNIGPEGMPALAQAFDRRDSSLSVNYRKIYPKLPGWLKRHLARPVAAEEIWNSASFVLLNNPNGRLALPELMRRLGDQKNPAHQYIIGAVEFWIRPEDKEFAPVLIQCLSDTNAVIRKDAAYSLYRIGAQASAAVPALTADLADTNLDVKINAAYALWTISGKTNPAAATLKEVLRTAPSYPGAYWAAVYLTEINPADADAIPALTGMLQSPEDGMRVSATVELGKHGAAASAAVPALKKEIENGSPQLKISAQQALKEIDPAAAAGYEQQ